MKHKITFVLSIISILISLALVSISLVNIKKSPTKIFENSLSSVVEVKASTGEVEAFGTAVIISDSELVTNFHVISFTSQSVVYLHNKIEIRFSNSNDYQVVEVKHYDSKLDLVLLVMENVQGKALKVNLSNISTGQKVLLLGNGNNLGISLTTGVISRSEVEINFNNSLNKFIQIDASSTSGMSGGALLDDGGRIIGIITLRLLDNNGTPIYGYVYAIPISIVLDFVNTST